jgi:hypothetical protein
VTVIPYLGGQYRIQLLRMDFPMDVNIVREMCTYLPTTARMALGDLQMAEDPEEYCRTLESVYNCEAPGRGRIRLDQTPENTRHPLRQYENAD